MHVADHLVKKCKVNLEIQDSKGCTALYYAVKQVDIYLLEALVDNGADINAMGPKGVSILGWACEFGDLEFVETLIEDSKKFTPNLKPEDEQGNTLLIHAV